MLNTDRETQDLVTILNALVAVRSSDIILDLGRLKTLLPPDAGIDKLQARHGEQMAMIEKIIEKLGEYIEKIKSESTIKQPDVERIAEQIMIHQKGTQGTQALTMAETYVATRNERRKLGK